MSDEDKNVKEEDPGQVKLESRESVGNDDNDDSKSSKQLKQESQSTNKLVDDAASESEDGGDFDSSEDDEDEDEDEEAIRKVREGFIVSDDEAAEEEENAEESKESANAETESAHKKREASDEELDEDDLELLRENAGESPSGRSRFKRLKRAGDEEEDGKQKGKGLTEMFSDEENDENEAEDEDDLMEASRKHQRQQPGEFDDFIEEDELSEDDEDRDERVARMRSAKAKNHQFAAEANIDQDKMDELYEIFGDGEDYAWALEAEKAKSGEAEKTQESEEEGDEKPKAPALSDVFEYGELKKHLMTDEDEHIRQADIPERYQILRQGIEGYELTDEQFVMKQTWVAEQLYEEKKGAFGDAKDVWEPFKDAVSHVERFVSRENLEVPTIWSCRKDYTLQTYTENGELHVRKLLDEDDLWRIVELDLEYHAVLSKKAAVQKLYKSLKLDTPDSVYTRMMKQAKRITALQDVEDYLRMRYHGSNPGAGSNGAHASHAQARRFRRIDRVIRDPAYNVVKAVGLNAAQFGENVGSDARIYTPEDSQKTPEEVAAAAVGGSTKSAYASAESATAAAEACYAAQIAYNPEVRAKLRSAYQDYATVDVKVTEKGRVEIGERSRYADFKYAENRAMESFAYEPDVFLRMVEAESLGLCQVEIGLKAAYGPFVDHLFTLLSSDGTSAVSAAWNALRRRVLDAALKRLVPQVATALKQELARKCKRRLFYAVRARFLDKVDQAPYASAGKVAGAVPRVLALSNGDGRRDAAVLGAELAEDGSVVRTVKFDAAFREDAFGKQLQGIVEDFQPDVIAVSGYTPETSYLYKKVSELAGGFSIGSSSTDATGDVASGAPTVIYAQNETALAYEHSARAAEELPGVSRVGRFAVGLARYVQSPLLEYIGLGEGVGAISVLRYQDVLPREDFVRAVRSVFVDMVCLVGVKLNDAVRSSYIAQALPFVAGLGARKASALVRAIESAGGAVVRRDELITRGLMGKVVFLNCASFINLPQDENGRVDDEAELLDATRIHPEDYGLARKMAYDALDVPEEERGDGAADSSQAVAQLYEAGTDKLDDLLLEGYADQLEKHGHRKRATLEMIKEELQSNYEELRKPFRLLSAEEVFYMLTGETADTFAEGLQARCVVQRVDPRYMTVITQSGVRGNVSRGAVLSYDDPTSLAAKFTMGQPVKAAIKEVDYADFRAEMSLLAADLANTRSGPKIDKFKGLWDFEAEQKDEQRLAGGSSAGGAIGGNNPGTAISAGSTAGASSTNPSGSAGSGAPSFINHPYFRDVNSQQAERLLAPRDAGAFVIRPSSKGPDHLAVTLKLASQLFVHLDIVQHDRPNDYTLGRILQVGQFRYHDLDELIVEHVRRLFAKVTELSQSSKFREGPAADARSWLIRYSTANKNRSCYCFCLNRKAPGWFLLLFKLNDGTDRTYTWNVKALPTGYMLHGNVYPDVAHLCNGFKRLLQNQLEQGYNY